MALVIGIICIILIVVFWRIFRPIALVAGFGLGFLIVYSIHEYGQNEHQRMMAEQAVREKIASAKASASKVRRKWELQSNRDPASRQAVPRYASVLSDGGLCRLQVEVRIDGSRPIAIYCSDLKIDPSKDIEIQFDNRSTFDTMPIERFSNGNSVYIPPNHQLSYDEFLRRLAGGNKVSLLLAVEGAGQHWITFSLKGSRFALAKIGVL